MKIWCLLFLLTISLFSFAQEEEELQRCVHSHKALSDEEKTLMRKQEQSASQRSFSTNFRTESNVYQIPVVVHVVYRTSTEYVSYEQVLSQIAVLNQDFRRKNADTSLTPAPFKALAADAEIEFVLAKQDPAGNPTDGVTYTKTSSSSFEYAMDYVKYTTRGGIDPWNQNKYLNIYVCNLSSGLLGYVNTPLPVGSTRDGVVVSYRVFGTFGNLSQYFNKGRTATHEIGHWLGLFHVWGRNTSTNTRCGDDEVNDTPHQKSETDYKPVACPAFPSFDAAPCLNAPHGRMFSNFLDYSRDACMNIFTKGQVAKMHDTLLLRRSLLFISNNALVPPFENDLSLVEVRFDTASFCSGQLVSPRLRVANKGTKDVNSFKIKSVFNEVSDSLTWTGTLLSGEDTVILLSSQSSYQYAHSLKVNIELPKSNPDNYIRNNSYNYAFNCPSYLAYEPFVVYPNPVENILRMKGNKSKVLSATFYSLEGKEIVRIANPVEIDISIIPPGSYVVVFETESEKMRHQLIVIR